MWKEILFHKYGSQEQDGHYFLGAFNKICQYQINPSVLIASSYRLIRMTKSN
jgi:hypothetical protein